MNNPDIRKEYKVGVACAILCALIWGVLPIYWKSLQPINSLLIMFYRLVLACIFVFVADLFIYKWKGIIEPLKKKGAILSFFLAGLVISTNWGLYIWMVNSGIVIQTSIGYYIEPLAVCTFGILFFKEKMDKYKLAAFILACAGVAFMLLSYGEVPLMALLLAVTFAVYSAIKKKLNAPAFLALFYETLFLLPVVVPYIIYTELSGNGAFAVAGTYKLALLSLSGVFTAVPLVLFSMAANRITLIALGITEYISPSMGLMLGIFVFKEPFDLYQFIGFVFIWIGLIIFTVGGIKLKDQVRQEPEEHDNGTE